MYNFTVEWSAHSGSGNLIISSLPIAPSTVNIYWVGTFGVNNYNLPSNFRWGMTHIDGYTSTTNIEAHCVNSSGNYVSIGLDTSGSKNIWGTITYMTA